MTGSPDLILSIKMLLSYYSSRMVLDMSVIKMLALLVSLGIGDFAFLWFDISVFTLNFFVDFLQNGSITGRS